VTCRAVSTAANVKAVQTRLGHAPAAMTLNVYTDMFPDDLSAVSETLVQDREIALADTSRTSGRVRNGSRP
jgi:hypothetical protein